MSIPGAASPLFLATTAGAADAFEISRSLRFNSGDSAYLNRTPSSAGNRKTWTWSGWIKKTVQGSYQKFFSGGNTSDEHGFRFENTDQLSVYRYSGGMTFQVKTTRVFRDPSAFFHLVVAYDSSQGTASNRVKIYINGVQEADFATSNYPSQNSEYGINNTVEHGIGRLSGAPSSEYFNGYLAEVNFIDGQALAPTDFGETDDNGVWQAKEFTGTYGTPASTVLVGSPSYPSSFTSEGNKTSDQTGLSFGSWSGTYTGAETKIFKNSNTTAFALQLSLAGPTIDRLLWYSDNATDWTYVGNVSSLSNPYTLSGHKYYATSEGSGGATVTASSPATGVNSFRLAFTDNSSDAALGTDSSGNSNTWTVNNLLALAPGLATANQGMDVVTYSGNSTARNIGGLAFAPDLVIIKSRSNSGYNHYWVDSVRGTNKNLYSNLTESVHTADRLSSFNSDGFGLTSHDGVNSSGKTYVAWCFRAGGAASSNTNGTITSSVSANTTYGFSVVTYTGNATQGASVGHGLSTAPSWIIVKRRDAATNWAVGHSGLGAWNKVLYLNIRDSVYTQSEPFNGTTPTSSVFELYDSSTTNASGGSYVAYVWSEIAGFSKFSSYTGSGASKAVTGLGFKPKYVLFKSSSKGATSWMIADSTRGDNQILRAHTADQETTESISFSFDADGFSFNTSNDNFNESGQTYIYAAFAEKPDQSGIDSLVDTPSNAATPSDTGVGNEVVGNYATLNPLDPTTATLSNGNLDCNLGNAATHVRGTFQISSGKRYWEITPTSLSGDMLIGICLPTQVFNGDLNTSVAFTYYNDGRKFSNGSGSSYGASYTVNDVIGVAFDADAGTLTYYKNGVSQGTAFTGLTAEYFPAVSDGSSGAASSFVINFGQRAFAYPLSGYKSLNTASLPTPTIADGSKYFDTKLWTGNGGTQAITGLNFSPDFVWGKLRSGASAISHILYDAVRGAGSLKGINSDLTRAEGGCYDDASNHGYLDSFDANGFTVVDGNLTTNYLNSNNDPYVAWAWDAGTSTVTNNDGSIASQVRANPSAGFSIVSYNAGLTSSGSESIGHGLNTAPALIIGKDRDDGTHAWRIRPFFLNDNAYDYLEFDTGALAQFNSNDGTMSLPTSTTFDVNWNSSVGASNDIIAYCFAPVEGYSAMGSYIGNASADGPFVSLSFRPALVIIKCSSTSNSYTNWDINDSARDTFNVADATLAANISDAENSGNIGTQKIDFLSNGFKIRQEPTSSSKNLSGQTYIYIAFAENPFQANGGLAR